MECLHTLRAGSHQAMTPSSVWSGSSMGNLSPTHPGSKLFLTLVLSCLILLEWTQGTVGSTSALLSTSLEATQRGQFFVARDPVESSHNLFPQTLSQKLPLWSLTSVQLDRRERRMSVRPIL